MMAQLRKDHNALSRKLATMDTKLTRLSNDADENESMLSALRAHFAVKGAAPTSMSGDTKWNPKGKKALRQRSR